MGFKGTNRLNQLTDNAKVFYNRCQCRSNGWGVLSIDGSDDGVEMVVTDSELELYGPRSEATAPSASERTMCALNTPR